MRMLDICAGHLGWATAFIAKGWKVTALDLVEPPEIPAGVAFLKRLKGILLAVEVDLCTAHENYFRGSPKGWGYLEVTRIKPKVRGRRTA